MTLTTFELTIAQLTLIGLIASPLFLILRHLLEYIFKRPITPDDRVMQLAVYVVCFILGILWFPQAYPSNPLPELSGMEVIQATQFILLWLSGWLAALTLNFAAAHLIYINLLKAIREKVKEALPSVYQRW